MSYHASIVCDVPQRIKGQNNDDDENFLSNLKLI